METNSPYCIWLDYDSKDESVGILRAIAELSNFAKNFKNHWVSDYTKQVN
jgi:hypothetical protein